MEAKSSEDYKKLFLLAFTRELILHSLNKDIIKLQEIVKTKEVVKPKPVSVMQKIPMQIRTEKVFTPIPSIMSTIPERRPMIQPMRKIPGRVTIQRRRTLRPGVKSSLYIPEPSLPSHLEYLKPTPTNVEIDLGKLNPLIKDPAVRMIEVNPDEKIKVIGTMGTRTTGIILTKEEIDGIIDKFSMSSKIPAEEGIYRAVVGKLILSAIISEVIGSRFIIRKIMPVINQPYRTQQRIPMRTLVRKETIIKQTQ